MTTRHDTTHDHDTTYDIAHHAAHRTTDGTTDVGRHAADGRMITVPVDDAEAVLHLDDQGEIDRSIALLAGAGLDGSLVCDGSCGGLAGCVIAPIAGVSTVAA